MLFLRTMANLVQSSSRNRFETVIWTVKLVLLSVGVLSTVLLFKLAIPYSINLIVSTVPRVWIFFCSFLAPPYLYFVVNFIIISIVASSNFQQKHSEKKMEEKEEENPQQQQQLQKQRDSEEALSSQEKATEIWYDVPGEKSPESDDNAAKSGDEIWSDISCMTDSDENLALSAVSKPVEPLALYDGDGDGSDTLDDTWTAIMEGHGKLLTRQLKKSDTWNARVEPKRMAAASPELRKSETFNEGSSTTTASASASSALCGGGGGLRREIPLSQDELNQRVEAFIHNFRLQRQESHRKQYMAMLNRRCY